MLAYNILASHHAALNGAPPPPPPGPLPVIITGTAGSGKSYLTRNMCIAETREARGGGMPRKCQGWKGGENRSKLCSWVCSNWL